MSTLLEKRVEREQARYAKELPDDFSTSVFDNLKTVAALHLETNYGSLRDVDGNVIEFDRDGFPYIAVFDFENMLTWKVYVDLFTAEAVGAVDAASSRPLGYCTIDNPEGAVQVILSRIAPSLTPNGSIVPLQR